MHKLRRTPTRFIDHALDIIVSHLLTVSIDFLAFEASLIARPRKATAEQTMLNARYVFCNYNLQHTKWHHLPVS